MRQHTIFEPCPKHAGWFASQPRRRRAEMFVEGGPADSPCRGGVCEMRPGTGFYSSTFVAAHPVYTAELWEPNRQAIATRK